MRLSNGNISSEIMIYQSLILSFIIMYSVSFCLPVILASLAFSFECPFSAFVSYSQQNQGNRDTETFDVCGQQPHTKNPTTIQKKSGFTCQVLRVTCHKSLMPTATAMEPPPAKFPTMHRRMVRKYQEIFHKYLFLLLKTYPIFFRGAILDHFQPKLQILRPCSLQYLFVRICF